MIKSKPVELTSVALTTHARSTGATVIAGRLKEEGWGTICLNHSSSSTHPTRVAAELATSHPQDWCLGCYKISTGKSPKFPRSSSVELP